MTISIKYFFATGKATEVGTRFTKQTPDRDKALEHARLYAQEKHPEWYAFVSIVSEIGEAHVNETYILPPSGKEKEENV